MGSRKYYRYNDPEDPDESSDPNLRSDPDNGSDEGSPESGFSQLDLDTLLEEQYKPSGNPLELVRQNSDPAEYDNAWIDEEFNAIDWALSADARLKGKRGTGYLRPLNGKSIPVQDSMYQEGVANQGGLARYNEMLENWQRKTQGTAHVIPDRLYHWYKGPAMRLDPNIAGLRSAHPSVIRALLLFEREARRLELESFDENDFDEALELGEGWTIDEMLGKGGFGAAFLFEQVAGDSLFKMVVKLGRWDYSFYKDYNNEALAGIRLWNAGCRNIPEVFDWTVSYATNVEETEKQRGHFITAFEYCEHGNMENLLEYYQEYYQTFPEPFLWHVLYSLAKVLTYCARGTLAPEPLEDWDTIAHIDIKLLNVFLADPDPNDNKHYPTIKVGDWGMAYFEPQGELAKESRRFKRTRWRDSGTHGWHPPEADRNFRYPNRNCDTFVGKYKDMFTVGLLMSMLYAQSHGRGPYTKRLRDLIIACRHPDALERIDPYTLYRETKIVTEAFRDEMDRLADQAGIQSLSPGAQELLPYPGHMIYKKRHRDWEFKSPYITAEPVLTELLAEIPESLPHPIAEQIRDLRKVRRKRKVFRDKQSVKESDEPKPSRREKPIRDISPKIRKEDSSDISIKKESSSNSLWKLFAAPWKGCKQQSASASGSNRRPKKSSGAVAVPDVPAKHSISRTGQAHSADSDAETSLLKALDLMPRTSEERRKLAADQGSHNVAGEAGKKHMMTGEKRRTGMRDDSSLLNSTDDNDRRNGKQLPELLEEQENDDEDGRRTADPPDPREYHPELPGSLSRLQASVSKGSHKKRRRESYTGDYWLDRSPPASRYHPDYPQLPVKSNRDSPSYTGNSWQKENDTE